MKTDRRRQYPLGEKIVRTTISLPESVYLDLLKRDPSENLSRAIRNLAQQTKPRENESNG